MARIEPNVELFRRLQGRYVTAFYTQDDVQIRAALDMSGLSDVELVGVMRERLDGWPVMYGAPRIVKEAVEKEFRRRKMEEIDNNG